ncbi:NUDIX domain-containing protein [Sphingomonas sp. HF-S3]|jgi:bifunctional NMN adenylyltransferase/nudix hydrolase|uniref:NUDIX domain-containing protein n=1 Tax=Sphingomonas rustica TaxID=3103142 RepID=A0ABV0B4B8_9SPHN
MHANDFSVFIGRFQPLHIGHEHVVRQALSRTSHVIVLIGSANVARDPRNPFTYGERVAMFRKSFAYEMANGHLIVEPLDDHLYSDTAWCAEVQARVKRIALAAGGGTTGDGGNPRVSLAGYGKDATSYYLKMFPEWENIQIDSQYGTFSASDVRQHYFQRIPAVPRTILSPGVSEWLDQFALGEEFRTLLAEREYLDAYPAQWGKGPFVTADAVVIQSGHILLVERGRLPGKGLLALPGGFVDPAERVRDAAIRELREETGIGDAKGQIPPAMLASFIDDSRTRVFDAPDRSLRGRIITHAFLFRLPERRSLFTVKGGDDAAHAHWYRVGDLSAEQFFEDHWSIINLMADL